MSRLLELMEELINLEKQPASWPVGSDFASIEIQDWQASMAIFQAKLGHEELVQLTRMNNYLGAYHDVAITHAMELAQKIDALEMKVQALEAIVDESIVGAIRGIAEDVRRLPPEQSKTETFEALRELMGSGYEETQQYERKEDIK